MSNYRYYQEARDTAWRALLRLKEKRLPVDVFSLALSVGMETHPFPDEKENPRLAAMLAWAGEGDVLACYILHASSKNHSPTVYDCFHFFPSIQV